ncbi:MAG: nucleotidyltransferase domain-containing protein [Ruminococcus sp.]|nr:nucleotidyltransferase domain-containing protein [Ruminococcus sp.]
MAKTNYHAYFKGEHVKLKKYFYVLRPLLACRYIIDNGKPLPMLFSKLVEIELESSMKPFVDEILKAKMATSELGHSPKMTK